MNLICTGYDAIVSFTQEKIRNFNQTVSFKQSNSAILVVTRTEVNAHSLNHASLKVSVQG